MCAGCTVGVGAGILPLYTTIKNRAAPVLFSIVLHILAILENLETIALNLNRAVSEIDIEFETGMVFFGSCKC